MGSLLAEPYPDAEQWRELLDTFDATAIAHKLLLAHVPYIFKDEPLKYALFRKTIADAFDVEPTNVFIVGSAMAGRSLKADSIHQEYSTSSDIDTLIVSDDLFTSYVMQSLEWVNEISRPDFEQEGNPSPKIESDDVRQLGWLSMHARNGIWRPDSLPKGADAREQFFDKVSSVSLKTLGLQLSDDTVAKVRGRVARSFEDAVADLAESLRHLASELDDTSTKAAPVPEGDSQSVNGT